MPAPTTDPIELRLRWLDDAGWALYEEQGGVTAGVPFYLGGRFGRTTNMVMLLAEVRMIVTMSMKDTKYTLEIDQ